MDYMYIIAFNVSQEMITAHKNLSHQTHYCIDMKVLLFGKVYFRMR